MLNNYIKLALKVLGRRKFFTFISLFGISMTLVVLMLATAILDNVFVPRAPESRFDRALTVYSMSMTNAEGTSRRTGQPGYRFLDTHLRNLPGTEDVTIFSSAAPLPMYANGRKIETHLRRTDASYWQILDHTFIEGSPFTKADADEGRFVAVITDDMRDQLFGGAPALGKSIDVDGQRFRVVGVVRSVPITRIAGFSEIWAPIKTVKDPEFLRRNMDGFGGVVLARSEDDFPAMRAEFAARVKALRPEDPRYEVVRTGLDTTFEAVARLFFQDAEGGVRILRIVLTIATLLFITLPTLNLITINLSRIMERASEIGVRKAFGASSRTLVGQFIVENVVLTLIGGIVGFALALIAINALNNLSIIPYARFDVNFRIFAWGMLTAALFGVISGAYPAWRMSRLQAVQALRGGAA
ncbi:MAG TPA: ABC transporter permease [Thermoanaerobaculia bacterium]